MKINHKFIPLIFIFLISINSCKDYDNIPCIPENLKKNVIAFYPFTMGSLKDYSLDGHDLTSSGLPNTTIDRNGNADCAFSFKSSNNDYLTTNGDFTDGFENKSFSISVWFKPQGEFSKIPVENFVSRYDNKNKSWSLGLTDCRQTVAIIENKFLAFTEDYMDPCETYEEYQTLKWNHLIFTYNGNDLNIYKNGQISKENTYFSKVSGNKGDLFIGNLYNGFLDDIIIFNKALTDAEVQSIYEMDTCCEN